MYLTWVTHQNWLGRQADLPDPACMAPTKRSRELVISNALEISGKDLASEPQTKRYRTRSAAAVHRGYAPPSRDSRQFNRGKESPPPLISTSSTSRSASKSLDPEFLDRLVATRAGNRDRLPSLSPALTTLWPREFLPPPIHEVPVPVTGLPDHLIGDRNLLPSLQPVTGSSMQLGLFNQNKNPRATDVSSADPDEYADRFIPTATGGRTRLPSLLPVNPQLTELLSLASGPRVSIEGTTGQKGGSATAVDEGSASNYDIPNLGGRSPRAGEFAKTVISPSPLGGQPCAAGSMGPTGLLISPITSHSVTIKADSRPAVLDCRDEPGPPYSPEGHAAHTDVVKVEIDGETISLSQYLCRMRQLAISLVAVDLNGHQSDVSSRTSDLSRATAAINGMAAVLQGAAELVRRDIDNEVPP